MDTNAVLAALNDVYKLNSNRVVHLFENAEAGSSLENIELEGFIDYTKSQALQVDGFEVISDKIVSTLESADLDEYREYIDRLEEDGKRFISVLDSDFPQVLKSIEKPPLGLYVHGDVETYKGGVAVVGTRSATDHRIEFAFKIGKKLVEYERTIISGLATGIDEAAHRAAISHGGKTIAVLPGHIDKIYPSDNKQLARNIPKNGALISEVSNNIPLNQHRFVERNRITSGLSEVVIIGASQNSGGTVRQAEYADSQGVPILLYDPGNGDGQSPSEIKERGAYTFSDLDELDHLLANLPELRKPNGGNLQINEF